MLLLNKKYSFILLIVFPLIIAAHLQIKTFAQGGNNEINPNGYNKFFYENGIVSSEGWMRDGKPDGYWKTYYETGKTKSEGNRKNFELDSIWKFYNEQGIAVNEINFRNNKKNGLSISFSKEGLVIAEENYVENQKQDYSYYFYPTGEKQKKVFFKDDHEHGTAWEYSKEGIIISIIEYKNGIQKSIEKINRKDNRGLKQGKWKEFYPCPEPCLGEKGNIHFEGEYVDDKKHGYWREYDRKGLSLNTVKYNRGEVEKNAEELMKLDFKTEYYDNAAIKSIKSYKNGIPEGIFREYSPEGKIISSEVFKEGSKLGEGVMDERGIKQGKWKEYYADSTLRADGEYAEGQRIGEWKFYYKNGQKEQVGKYGYNEKPEGRWIWLYENGNIWREEFFQNGLEEGLMTEYDDTGKVVTKGEFVDGEREGTWFFDSGDSHEEGNYKAGKKDGEWKEYYLVNGVFDKNSELSFIGKFVDGFPDGKHVYYHPNGKKKLEGRYTTGLQDGEWHRYNEDGLPVLTILYQNGVEKKLNGVKIRPEN